MDNSCCSLISNTFNSSETLAEATDHKSVEFLEESLWLFENEIALDVYYTFLDYNSCSFEYIWAEGSIEQLAGFDAKIAMAMTFLMEWKRQKCHQQTMYKDTCTSDKTALLRMLLGRVGMFLEAWEPHKLFTTPVQYNRFCVE